jgi:hypothetical protein
VSDDDLGFSYEDWRKQWIEGGMKWDKGSSQPPLNWQATAQLKGIGVGLEPKSNLP